jgi:hypothetical protein
MAYFELKPKDWETNFFGFSYGLLSLTSNQSFDSLKDDMYAAVEELHALIQQESPKYAYIEMNLDSRFFFFIPKLEDLGFRLLDTKATYLTEFSQEDLQKQNFELSDENLVIRNKRESDYETILTMSVDVMVQDKVFVSKYKNSDFFSEDIPKKYYTEWIKNTFFAASSYFAVLTNKEDHIKGFFIYDKRVDAKSGWPIYKGILTVVDKDVRGKNIHLALQSFIFKQIKDEKLIIENATQVSNIPVIRNHIRSHRMLDSVTFILVRKSS